MRTCGDCTACCDGWLEIMVDGVQVEPGTPCPRNTGHSCRNYADRPQQCRNFNCAWIEGVYPDWMRPDKAKVIVVRDKPKQGVDFATPVGMKIPRRALDEMMKGSMEHGRPFIYQDREAGYKGFGPPGFTL